jgi:hypothetical protein
VTTDVDVVPPVAGALAPMEAIVDGTTSCTWLGTPVSIEPPPADQVAGLGDLGGLVPTWPGAPECASAGTVPPCAKGDHLD